MWYNVPMSDVDLLALLPPDLRTLAEAGEVVVSEGRNPEKPVVRWSEGPKRGKFVKGSGVVAAHVDSENGTRSAVKQTTEYRALMEKLVSLGDDPKQRGSFAWLMDQMFEAIEGGWTKVDVKCPTCAEEFTTQAWKKHDMTAATKLLDRLIPKAPQRTEIDIHSESIHVQLEERFDPSKLRVNYMAPLDLERREHLLDVEVKVIE